MYQEHKYRPCRYIFSGSWSIQCTDVHSHAGVEPGRAGPLKLATAALVRGCRVYHSPVVHRPHSACAWRRDEGGARRRRDHVTCNAACVVDPVGTPI